MAFPKRYFPKTYFPERYFPPVTEVSVVAVNRRVSMGSAGGPWKLKGDPFKKIREFYEELEAADKRALDKARNQVERARREGRLRPVGDFRDLGGSSNPDDLYIPDFDDLQLEDTGSPPAIVLSKAAVEAVEDAVTTSAVTRRVVASIIEKATESAKKAIEEQQYYDDEAEDLIELMLLGAI